MMTLLDVQRDVVLFVDDRTHYSVRHNAWEILEEIADMIDEQLCIPAFHGEVMCQ